MNFNYSSHTLVWLIGNSLYILFHILIKYSIFKLNITWPYQTMPKNEFILTFIPHSSGSELTHFPCSSCLSDILGSPQKTLSVTVSSDVHHPAYFPAKTFVCLCLLSVKLLEGVSQCHYSSCHQKNINIHNKSNISLCQQSYQFSGCQITGFHVMK